MFTQTIETVDSMTTVSLKIPPHHRALITLLSLAPTDVKKATESKKDLILEPSIKVEAEKNVQPNNDSSPNVSIKQNSKSKENLSKLSDADLINILAQYKEERQISNRDLGMALGQHGPSLSHNQKDGLWPGEISRLLRKLITPSEDRRKRIISYLASNSNQ